MIPPAAEPPPRTPVQRGMLLAALLHVAQVPSAHAIDYPGRFGASACLCGDVDGDGRSEFAIVADRREHEADSSVWVFSGAYGSLIRTLDCVNGGGGIGVARVGDVDGDQVDDLAMSCCVSSDITTEVDVANDPAVDVVELRSGRTGQLIRQIVSTPTERSFGDCIERLEDLDGDGRSEVLISSLVRTEERVTGQLGLLVRFRMMWRVYSTGSGRSLVTYRSASPLKPLVPQFPGTLSAPSACALGDADDDCTPDFAVVDGNTVAVVSSVTGVPIRLITLPRDSDSYRFGGVPMCSPGDLDGDGCADLVIAGVARDPLLAEGWESTALRAYSTKAGSVLYDVQGDAPGIGHSVVAAGDCDGDGIRDLLVSRHHQYYGVGRTWVASGRDGRLLTTMQPSDDSWGGGLWLCGDADVDGDGLADVLATNFQPFDSGMRGTGAKVYSGRSGLLLHSVVRRTGLTQEDW